MSKLTKQTQEHRKRHEQVYEAVKAYGKDFMFRDIIKTMDLPDRVVAGSILTLLRSGCIVKVGFARDNGNKLAVYKCTYKPLVYIKTKRQKDAFMQHQEGIMKVYLGPNHYQVRFGANVKSGSGQSAQTITGGFSSLEVI